MGKAEKQKSRPLWAPYSRAPGSSEQAHEPAERSEATASNLLPPPPPPLPAAAATQHQLSSGTSGGTAAEWHTSTSASPTAGWQKSSHLTSSQDLKPQVRHLARPRPQASQQESLPIVTMSSPTNSKIMGDAELPTPPTVPSSSLRTSEYDRPSLTANFVASLPSITSTPQGSSTSPSPSISTTESCRPPLTSAYLASRLFNTSVPQDSSSTSSTIDNRPAPSAMDPKCSLVGHACQLNVDTHHIHEPDGILSIYTANGWRPCKLIQGAWQFSDTFPPSLAVQDETRERQGPTSGFQPIPAGVATSPTKTNKVPKTKTPSVQGAMSAFSSQLPLNQGYEHPRTQPSGNHQNAMHQSGTSQNRVGHSGTYQDGIYQQGTHHAGTGQPRAQYPGTQQCGPRISASPPRMSASSPPHAYQLPITHPSGTYRNATQHYQVPQTLAQPSGRHYNQSSSYGPHHPGAQQSGAYDQSGTYPFQPQVRQSRYQSPYHQAPPTTVPTAPIVPTTTMTPALQTTMAPRTSYISTQAARPANNLSQPIMPTKSTTKAENVAPKGGGPSQQEIDEFWANNPYGDQRHLFPAGTLPKGF